MAPPKQPRSLISVSSLVARESGSPSLEIGDDVLTYEQLWNYAGKITTCLKESLDPRKMSLPCWPAAAWCLRRHPWDSREWARLLSAEPKVPAGADADHAQRVRM